MALQAQLYSGDSFGGPQDFQLVAQPSHLPVHFPTAVSLHMEAQGWEMEQFINTQNERLRCAIQEDLRTSGLLSSFESEAAFLVAQKDEEIAAAASRTAELMESLRSLEAQGLAWRTMAMENMLMAESLSGTIRQMKIDYPSDEESYFSAGGEEESYFSADSEEESYYSAPGEGLAWCKWCEEREARVVLLPCRHLCLCRWCEAFLLVCPVCMAGKEGSITVES